MVWPHQRYYNLDQLKKTMKYILDNHNIIFSVREDGTKEWLEKTIDFKSDKIFTIPDPAIYVPTKDHNHPEIVEGKKNIIISLNGEDEEYRFGGRKREVFWQFFSQIMSEATIRNIWKKIPGWDSSKQAALKQLALAIERISQDGKINIILVPHYFDDYKMISEMIPYFSSSFPHRNVISAGMLRVDKTEYFYDLYAKVDLALSMRIHSMSPSIGIGTPMIALTTQTRMTAFMENAGLSDFVVNMFDPKLTDKLCELINYCLNNKNEVVNKFSSSIGKMREKTCEFNKKIEEIFTLDCDILIPAATPDVIHKDNVNDIKAKLVLEGANIPATKEAEDILHKKGVVVVPDFIANAGGVIMAAMEYARKIEKEAFEAIAAKIKTNTKLILEQSKTEGALPRKVAEEIARERVLKAME